MVIAINGFGRIGRAAFKAIIQRKDLKIIVINDLANVETLAHLLKYDSCYGKFNVPVKSDKGHLIVGNKKYKVFSEKDPSILPWKELGVDMVIESTGIFCSRETASIHLKAGAKKVIITAPPKGDRIKTIVMGVNEEKIRKSDRIISNASCTTNCLAPVVDCVRRNFGIKSAIMTTVHSYTTDQLLVDGPHKDLRRARAAALNIVPTTTGAARSVAEVIPSLKGKFDGMAIRVPTPVGSLCDIVFVTRKKATAEQINNSLQKAAKSAKLKNILAVTSEPLVSQDFVGNPASAIVDLNLTKVIGGDLAKVIAWYDNEWGYSNRLADLCEYIAKKRLI